MNQVQHHLKGIKKSLDHRARIAASRKCDKEKYPEHWDAEFRLALLILKQRKKIDKKFGSNN